MREDTQQHFDLAGSNRVQARRPTVARAPCLPGTAVDVGEGSLQP